MPYPGGTKSINGPIGVGGPTGASGVGAGGPRRKYVPLSLFFLQMDDAGEEKERLYGKKKKGHGGDKNKDGQQTKNKNKRDGSAVDQTSGGSGDDSVAKDSGRSGPGVKAPLGTVPTGRQEWIDVDPWGTRVEERPERSGAVAVSMISDREEKLLKLAKEREGMNMPVRMSAMAKSLIKRGLLHIKNGKVKITPSGIELLAEAIVESVNHVHAIGKKKTGSSSDGPKHTHSLPGGGKTGPPVFLNGDHYHKAKKTKTGPEIELKSEDLEEAKISQPQKCKSCDNPATKGVIWADGRAYVPTCDKHLASWKKKLADVVAVRKIPQRQSTAAKTEAVERLTATPAEIKAIGLKWKKLPPPPGKPFETVGYESSSVFGKVELAKKKKGRSSVWVLRVGKEEIEFGRKASFDHAEGELLKMYRKRENVGGAGGTMTGNVATVAVPVGDPLRRVMPSGRAKKKKNKKERKEWSDRLARLAL